MSLSIKCACGTKVYRSEEVAQYALEKIQRLGLRGEMPKRVARCGQGQWHLEGSKAVETGPDRSAREVVKLRENWQCAVCGVVIFKDGDWSIHHRRNRGSGGSSDPAINRPSNLLLVCGSGTTLCHGDLTDNEQREVALEAGWVVSTNSRVDPASVPVAHALYGRVLLLDDGTFTDARRAA